MPQHLPQIPDVDKQTSYQKLKGIVAKLREEFLRSYLFDSTSVSIVDNPGKGRSAEVNFPNQGVPIIIRQSIDLSAVPALGAHAYYQTAEATTIPNGCPFSVDNAYQFQELALIGQCVTAGTLVLTFWNSDPVTPHSFGATQLTVQAVVYSSWL